MAMTAQHWSISGLSVELKLDRRTLAKRLQGLEPDSEDKRAKYYLMASVIEHLYINSENEKLDLAQEQALLAQARRKKIEAENDLMSGQLCNTDEMIGYVVKQISTCKSKLLAIPQQAHEVLQAKDYAEAVMVLRDLITQALEEISAVDNLGSKDTKAD